MATVGGESLGGVGCLRPICSPPPPFSGLKRQAAQKGLGGAQDGGRGVPSHTYPKNDLHDALIILKYISWGTEISERFSNQRTAVCTQGL